MTEKIFFSYSRADSAFVLRLANDLRKAGVGIWLDQLDIKPGSHWDSAIEMALTSAPRLLVILSNESVKSNNVMDEVSFALECNKTVIPVLLQECTVPFRLRRLQRIDFTGNYETGFNQLLEELCQMSESDNSETEDFVEKNKSPEPKKENLSKLVDKHSESLNPTSHHGFIPPLQTTNKLHKANVQETGNQKKEYTKKETASPSQNKKFVIGLVIVVVIGLVIWALPHSKSASKENVMAIKSDSVQTSNSDSSSKLPSQVGSQQLNLGGPVADDGTIQIGERLQGGYVFYIDNSGSHGLVAAPRDFDVKSKSNFNFCDDLKAEIANYNGGGFSDWRLPTIEELRLLYNNRNVVPGLNLNSVPDADARVGYYSSYPNSNCEATGKVFKTGIETYGPLDHYWNFRLVRSF